MAGALPSLLLLKTPRPPQSPQLNRPPPPPPSPPKKGLRILAALGHSLAAPYPALTPLTGPHPGGAALAGLSLQTVRLSSPRPRRGGGSGKKAAPASPRGGFLFTHKGFSGPSVLDASHSAVLAFERGLPPPPLLAAWTGEGAAEWDARLRAGGGAGVSAVLQRGGVRERLAAALCGALGLTGRAAAQVGCACCCWLRIP